MFPMIFVKSITRLTSNGEALEVLEGWDDAGQWGNACIRKVVICTMMSSVSWVSVRVVVPWVFGMMEL